MNISQFVDDSLIYIKEDIKIANSDSVKSENRSKMKLSLNRHFNDKFLSFLIINTIYASVLKMNFLSLNILDIDHDFCVNLDVFTKLSQILKRETVIRNFI